MPGFLLVAALMVYPFTILADPSVEVHTLGLVLAAACWIASAWAVIGGLSAGRRQQRERGRYWND